MNKTTTATGSWRDAYHQIVRLARQAQEAGDTAEAMRLFKFSDSYFGKSGK